MSNLWHFFFSLLYRYFQTYSAPITFISNYYNINALLASWQPVRNTTVKIYRQPAEYHFLFSFIYSSSWERIHLHITIILQELKITPFIFNNTNFHKWGKHLLYIFQDELHRLAYASDTYPNHKHRLTLKWDAFHPPSLPPYMTTIVTTTSATPHIHTTTAMLGLRQGYLC